MRRSLASLAWAGGISRLARRMSRDSLVILCYHRVLPEVERNAYPMRDLVVSPRVLEEHVDYCRRHYDCLPVGEGLEAVKRHRRGTRPLLAFTFDDGYWDNHKYAGPILNSYGIRGSFFVITSLIESHESPWYDRLARSISRLRESDIERLHETAGDDRVDKWLMERCAGAGGTSPATIVSDAKQLSESMRKAVTARAHTLAGTDGWNDIDRIMTTAELLELSRNGHEIGSHTRSHPILTQLAAEDLEDELEGSKSDLEGILSQRIASLCYPNGDYNDAVVSAAREAGYTFAVTTRSGFNTKLADPLRLRRFFVSQDRLSRIDGRCSRSLLALEFSGLADTMLLRRTRRRKPG